jgi:hypothetical protein
VIVYTDKLHELLANARSEASEAFDKASAAYDRAATNDTKARRAGEMDGINLWLGSINDLFDRIGSLDTELPAPPKPKKGEKPKEED